MFCKNNTFIINANTKNLFLINYNIYIYILVIQQFKIHEFFSRFHLKFRKILSYSQMVYNFQLHNHNILLKLSTFENYAYFYLLSEDNLYLLLPI